MKEGILCLLVAVAFLGSAAADSVEERIARNYDFKSSYSDALVLFEIPAPNEYALFREVDLETGRFKGKNIDFQMPKQGSSILKLPGDKVPLKYYLRRMEPGDYALVGVTRWRYYGRNSEYLVTCFMHGASVYRIEPGKVNYVTPSDELVEKWFEPEEVKFLQRESGGLSEHVINTLAGVKTIDADLIEPEVLAKVRFDARKNNASNSVSCPRGRKFEVLNTGAENE